ncbi:DUF6624 domain-containing protein [Stenotrophomonas mori]|uniref:Uncharacterized protein n=1 Tax=Stenotrophomonas mori TaxID=2871096 RepID=A0ABT0SIW4_9GAMM|nr:DUF6624 domain-containing protein [Stenotrophomonas mori]MCL7715277.1 hypothetical protein [Stenotrophomonas mori]
MEDARRWAGITPSAPQLRERLLEMARLDQDARDGDGSQEMITKMLGVDAAHLPRIKQVVADHHGLPGVREVGADGMAAAWLLVPHADTYAAVQQQVLEGLAPKVDSGEAAAREYALLVDRVLVNTGMPQRHGSQLAAISGSWQPKPMEVSGQVDARRAALGLMPLADYPCVAVEVFPVPATDADGKLL